MWFRFLYVTKITFYTAMMIFYVVIVIFFLGGGSQYIFLCAQDNVSYDQDTILSGFMWPRECFMWPIYNFMWSDEVLCDQY